MSLRRVPPNLLVGQGAADFAFESGMAVLPHDCLISQGAKERWRRWKYDLKKVKRQASSGMTSDFENDKSEEEKLERPHVSRSRSSQNRLMAGLQNESQPYSPQPGPSKGEANRTPESHIPSESLATPQSSPLWHQLYTDSAPSPQSWKHAGNHSHGEDGHNSQYLQDSMDDETDGESFIDTDPQWTPFRPIPVPASEGKHRDETGTTTSPTLSSPSFPASMSPDPMDRPHFRELSDRVDDITDTVGAIAVDCFGNIAAGSSSGGIGMKHKGRTGPAALVGIGTTVIPIESDDKTKTCVAAVTSGTGEHMATTMAASTCARRLATSTKRGKGGKSVVTDEEDAMRQFVETDFMSMWSRVIVYKGFSIDLHLEHPSVKSSHSAGAIGVMAVKKTVDGMYLHFAHNTDSFVRTLSLRQPVYDSMRLTNDCY